MSASVGRRVPCAGRVSDSSPAVRSRSAQYASRVSQSRSVVRCQARGGGLCWRFVPLFNGPLDCGKPLFLHQRDAHADLIACMDNVLDRSGSGRVGRVVVHCFTGEKGELFDYLDRDFYIGITGWICDERRGLHLRELVRHIPAERLLLETDAPYLLPRNLKPMPAHRRNEPMYLAHICAEVARDRGEDVAVTAANATVAARAFFDLPTYPAAIHKE